MSSPLTGATPEQIEAGVQRKFIHVFCQMEDPYQWEDCPPERQQYWIDFATIEANYLVPPTHRIVAVEDLRMIVGGLSTAELESGECPSLNQASRRVWDLIRDGEVVS